MIYQLVKSTNPLLHQKLPRFDFSNPPIDPKQLAHDLAETMVAKNGVGLSANQVGLPYRAFVVASDPIMCCFNPIIVDQSPQTMVLDEACLSLPGITVKKDRPLKIRIRFTLPSGETVTEIYQGMTARIMCHEMEHMEGKLITTGLSRITLDILIKKAKKLGFNYTHADFRSNDGNT